MLLSRMTRLFNKLLGRTVRTACVYFCWLLGSLVLVACSPQTHHHADISAENLLDENPIVFSSRESEQFFHLLTAEIYSDQGDELDAVDHYVLAAQSSDNKELVKIATVAAAVAGQSEEALTVAKRWVKISPNSLEARQYLALLLLRTNQFAASSRELNNIRLFVDANSETLLSSVDPTQANSTGNTPASEKLLSTRHTQKINGIGDRFVSQMLDLESHYTQAFEAYNAYVTQYGYEKNSDLAKFSESTSSQISSDGYQHQQMTLASLAMKSGKYQTADLALKDIHTQEALLIRSKALDEQGLTRQALQLIKPIALKKDTEDSTKLEYVKLLVADNQQDEAIQILNSIVAHHPDNMDLLTSLIVLNIDQQRWKDAAISVKKLMGSSEHQSDAYHFLGEIHEAHGEYDKALHSYQQVTSGNLVQSAMLKIPVLLERQKGLSAARFWIHKQRLSLKDNITKASLSKVEADLLFAHNSLDTALEWYQRAMVIDPKNTDLRYSRALAYEQLGKIALAEKDFQHILSIDQNDKTTLNALGYMLATHTERFDEAFTFINKAHQIDPSDAAIIDSLGWLHYRKGEIDEAERYLRIAYNDMKSPEVAGHLIQVLQKKGQKQEARVILKQMKHLFPEDESLINVEKKLN